MEGIRAVQDEFKQLHQQLGALQAEVPSIVDLQAQVRAKENERASLRTRVARARDKAEACAPAFRGSHCFVKHVLRVLISAAL
jgi:septal ring factor EnvC (AmiA/AmiB activator)